MDVLPVVRQDEGRDSGGLEAERCCNGFAFRGHWELKGSGDGEIDNLEDILPNHKRRRKQNLLTIKLQSNQSIHYDHILVVCIPAWR
jgi:hypothetical protein